MTQGEDELAQNVSKKTFSDEIFLDFSFESSESYRVFIFFYMIRMFGLGDLFLKGFSTAQ